MGGDLMSAPKTTPSSLSVPPAVARYGNIIFRDGPVHDGDVFSRKHPKMSQQNRAKLFAPFAALVGFDERVHKKEIVYVSKHELDADEEWELNHRLYKLHCLTANSRLARANMVSVSIEYFAVCTDEENDAYLVKGQYKTITGVVLRVDPHEQCISIQSEVGTHVIPFSDVYRIFKPTG
jgi:hypothetical protein